MSKSPDFMANKATSAPAPAGRLRERERHVQWPSSGRAARLRCVDLAAYASESFSICRSTIWNTRTNASVPMPTPTHTACCTHVPCCQKLARLHSMHLAASGAAGEGRAARLRVPQAAARLAPRGRRELNGKEHVRVQREQRRRIATQQLLVGESARVLRDEEWPRASTRPVGEAPGDQLHGHFLESVFW